MEADKVRHDIKNRVDLLADTGDTTPHRARSTQNTPRTAMPQSSERHLVSPLSGDGSVFSNGPDIPNPIDFDQRSDWGTDAEGSISDIDGDLHPGDQEVVNELLEIWSGDERPSDTDRDTKS